MREARFIPIIMTGRPTLTIVPFLALTACLLAATQVGARGF